MSHSTYKIDKDLTERPVNLLYITHSKDDAVEWHSQLHSHHFTELFYIKSGNGRFLFEDHSNPISAGDFIIINPNIVHTEISSKSDSLEYIAIGFEGFTFKHSQGKKAAPGIFIHPNQTDQIKVLLDTLIMEAAKQNTLYENYCQNLLEILLIFLLRHSNYQVQRTDNKQINSHIVAVKEYIEVHFNSDITLDKLAEVSHMSKYYMAHSFRESFGVSPIEYLNNIRINEACILLETTNFSIAEVSDFTGFSSQSYFSQSFKAKLSITPSEYRKVRKENVQK